MLGGLPVAGVSSRGLIPVVHFVLGRAVVAAVVSWPSLVVARAWPGRVGRTRPARARRRQVHRDPVGEAGGHCDKGAKQRFGRCPGEPAAPFGDQPRHAGEVERDHCQDEPGAVRNRWIEA